MDTWLVLMTGMFLGVIGQNYKIGDWQYWLSLIVGFVVYSVLFYRINS